MDIHVRSTGCFKSHVNTPHRHNMFGNLVVYLPSQFSGGALVTRHNGEQINYKWFSSIFADDQSKDVHWVALCSDVEHEIFPVTKGYGCDLDLQPVP